MGSPELPLTSGFPPAPPVPISIVKVVPSNNIIPSLISYSPAPPPPAPLVFELAPPPPEPPPITNISHIVLSENVTVCCVDVSLKIYIFIICS